MNALRSSPVLAALLLALAVVPARAAKPVAPLLEAIEAAATPEARTRASNSLYWELDRGNVLLGEDGARDLARMLVKLALDPASGSEWYHAAELMERYAHPEMVEPLLAGLDHLPPGRGKLRDTTNVVLARLHDPRLAAHQLEMLQSRDPAAVRMATVRLAEMGDAAAVPALEHLLADPTLPERFRSVRPREAERDAADVRRAARLAIDQLRLLDRAGIACGFDLETSAMDTLAARGFVVPLQPANEMFEWYSEEYPFVTTDFVYHTAMILVRAAFDEVEGGGLADAVGGLCRDLVQASLAQAARRPGAADAALARRNAAFFAVPAVLCGRAAADSLGLEAPELREVAAELGRIEAAATVAASPLLGVTEDYTEYRPRGRFSAPGADVGYFRAVTWLGRAAFPVQDPAATRRALLIAAAIAGDPELTADRERIDRVLTMLAGEPDDPTPGDYLRLAEQVSGRAGAAAVDAVLADASPAREFARTVAALPAPRVNTGVAPDREAGRGMRVLGQRYSRDAHLLQRVMEDGVWPPSGLHVLAGLLGNGRAAAHLGGPVAAPAGMPEDLGPGLMDGWLDCYAPALADDPAVPAVFRTRAWQDKQLNSALGAWAETRLAVAPYLKAAHQNLGMSAMTDPLHGFVEPYPQFFARLAARMRALDGLLGDLGVYDRVAREQADLEREMDERYGKADKHGVRKAVRDHRAYYERQLDGIRLDENRLPGLVEILDRLVPLATKCRDGVAQDPDDGVFLKSLRRRMQALGFNQSSSPVAEESMARVIDVATEYQSGQVLEAGIGRALPIYVAVPAGDRRVVCRGAIYSYYEFVVPLAGRMTDIEWTEATTQPEDAGGGPWLDRACGLIHYRYLDREALLRVDPERSSNPYSSLNASRPWELTGPYHAWNGELAGVRTDAADVGVLLDLAGADDPDPAVALFATRELARHADRSPIARAFFRAAVDSVAATPARARRQLDDFTAMRLYLGIGVLGRSNDPQDRRRLDDTVAMLAAWTGESGRWARWIPGLLAAADRARLEMGLAAGR